MIRTVLVLLLLIAIGECTYHVVQTDVANKKSTKIGMDVLREYTRERLRQYEEKKEDIDELDESDEGTSGTVITPVSTLVVYFENPSDQYEQVIVRDFLPQRALIQEFRVHSEGESFSSVEYEDKTEAEQAFFRASQEGKTALMLNKSNKSTSSLRMEMATEDDKSSPEQPSDASQISRMIMKVSPYTAFSLTLSFQEEVDENADLDEFKDLYSTRMSFEVGPRGSAIRGLVESPNYPNEYPSNSDMQWLIHMPVIDNYGIKFTINELDTEACCDRLTVYDGLTTNARVAGVWAGSYEDSTEFSLTTESSDLLVQFQSDCYESTGLFSYTFESVPINVDIPTCESNTDIIGAYGSFVSPGYPNDYPASSDCIWSITTTAGSLAEVTIVEFNIHETDILTIFYHPEDGGSTVLLAEYTGHQQPGLSVHSQTNNILLRLITNTHLIPLSGFSFNYNSLKAPTACEEGLIIVDEVDGYIQSENYPISYANNSTCTWQLNAKTDRILGIQIEEFSTEQIHDTLLIYDGSDSSSYVLAEVSGNNGQERTYFTTQEDAYLVFNTDESTTDNGFRIYWSEYVDYSSCQLDSPLNPIPVLESTRGFVSSLYYPNPFPGSRTCNYYLRTTYGTATQIILRRYDFGESRLVMYDGASDSYRIIFDSNNLLVQSGYNYGINATQHKVYMEFSSDVANGNHTGFTFYYSEISLDTITVNLPQQLGDEPRGTFQSALYPGWYPETYNVDAWQIHTNPDTFVSVRMDYFNVGLFNQLTFYDGQDQFGEIIHTCSGADCPQLLKSDSNEMYIEFISDNSNPGFQFTYFSSPYRCTGATKTVDAEHGYITSSNYPYQYFGNERCSWDIIAEEGKNIVFDLEFMMTEKDYDILLVYDVDSSTLVANLSGVVPPSTFETGYHAYVEFNTDEYSEARGFELHNHVSPPKENITTDEYTCRGLDIIENSQGVIYSHNYPESYPSNLDYCWTIVPPSEHTFVRFDFSTFVTEENYDVVNIYVGTTTEKENLLESFSGTLGAFGVDISTTEPITVLFHTDIDTNLLGFALEYSF